MYNKCACSKAGLIASHAEQVPPSAPTFLLNSTVGSSYTAGSLEVDSGQPWFQKNQEIPIQRSTMLAVL